MAFAITKDTKIILGHPKTDLAQTNGHQEPPRHGNPGGWHSLRIFSKVLNREATVSWQGDDPKIVYLDQAGYSLGEISRLKQTKNPDMIKKTHTLKSTFEGDILR